MKVNKFGYEFEVVDREFWNEKEWEVFTYECVHNFSHKDKLFIDIGAWVGPISLFASKFNNTCFAFEPDPKAYEELTKNIELNSIKNIKTYPFSIMNYTGKVKLGNAELGNSNTSFLSDENVFEAQCVSLTDISQQIDPNNISIIKIDVEGAETEILKDEFFKRYTGPIHLSIHPTMFKNKLVDLQFIHSFIQKYRYHTCNLAYLNLNLNKLVFFEECYSVLMYN